MSCFEALKSPYFAAETKKSREQQREREDSGGWLGVGSRDSSASEDLAFAGAGAHADAPHCASNNPEQVAPHPKNGASVRPWTFYSACPSMPLTLPKM